MPTASKVRGSRGKSTSGKPTAATFTFLFTDLVGSTALSVSLGDRAAQERVRAHVRIVQNHVRKHQAHTVRLVGDGFMVTFTSAVRAVSCAAEIQRGLAQYHRLHPEHSVQVRVGLNCGEAIYENGDFYGAAVNAANRICAEAQGGQILVSALVKEMVGGHSNVEFVDRGESLLKGFNEPWRLYEVVRRETGSIADTLASALEERTPFVGREGELGRIKGLIDSAREGRGIVTMLTGEAGVGKTRLATEASAYASHLGFTVLVGQCYDVGGPPAYGPFIDGLDLLVRQTPRPSLRKMLGDGAGWVAKLVPEVRQKLPGLLPTPPLPADQERHFLLASVVEFITQTARRAPVLWVLEDLHWSDKPTQLLLRSLARVVADQPIALIGTLRDIEVDDVHPVTETLTELHRQPYYNRLPVSPFGPEEVRLMLLALAEQEPPASLATAIFRETEGNPLFVEEFIKLLLEEERLFDEVGNWRSDLSARTVRLPTGVGLVIDRRLSRLSQTSRQVLTTAAVIGRNFRYDHLAATVDLAVDALLDALDEAAHAHLIHSDEIDRTARFTFAHELIWQSLYRELSPPRRQHLHLRAANVLEQAYASRADEHATELVYHYHQAGSLADSRKTYRYLVAAGDQAIATSAFETAMGYYEQAKALPVASDGGGADLLLRLGSAQQSTGDWDGAGTSWRAAISAYHIAGDGEGIERVCYALSLLHGWRGQFTEAFHVTQEGLQAAPESASEARSRLLFRAGSMLSTAGQPGAAEPLIEQALQIAERRGDAALLGSVLATKGAHERIYLRLDASCVSLDRAEQLLRAAGDLAGLSLCFNYQVPALGYLGRHAEVERVLTELQGLSEKLGDAAGTAVCALMNAGLALVRGELPAAETWARHAEEIARRSARLVLPAALQVAAEVEFLAGRWDRVEERFIEAAQLYATMGNPPTGYVGPLSRLVCRAFRADREGVQELLPELCKVGEVIEPASCGDCDRLATAAVAVALLGLRPQAAELYPALSRFADTGVVFASVAFPLLQRVLGMLAATNHRADQAVEHFEAALRQAQQLGARKEAAETSYFYARLLLDPDGPGDHRSGVTWLDRAIEGYAEIGMPQHLEKARQLRAGIAT